ncbi:MULTISPECIES: hypothetical protein [Sphingobacterium]|uniref:hypothetical protein n=1 Tax=Sphingobacterium TaxID=28453 RepID=UPI0028AAA8A3|nr:hypothetical protein [Sphingobacterium multivorum]
MKKKKMKKSNPDPGIVRACDLENPLDWYALTERSSAILNDLIAYTGRETFWEQQKDNPDQQRIDALWRLFKEIDKINRNVDNFRCANRMKKIIDEYGPKLKKVNMGGQLV